MERDLAELLLDGHRILPSLLADLRAAEREIHVSIFLFFRDPIGLEIADVLMERARAGVRVRVLLNVEKTAMGDPFSTGEREMIAHDPSIDYDPLDVTPLCVAMTHAGVQVIDSNIDYDRVIEIANPRLRSLAEQIRGSIEVDALHIDHRKIVIVDGRVAYCGGANIGAQYLYHHAFVPNVDATDEATERLRAQLPEPWWKWHDSLTRFEGPIAQRIEEEFHGRWVLDGGEHYEPLPAVVGPIRGDERHAVTSARVYTNAPNDQPNEVRELYLEHIRTAEQSIFIENPYLYHHTIAEALCTAKRARPSLRVVLVLPSLDQNDNIFGQDAQQHHYARYLACGIEVYEYRNHFTHLKIAAFDERFTIHGSTNLNYRSLEDDKDFELVVLVDDRALARRVLVEVRDVDIERSVRMTDALVHGGSFQALCVRVRNPWTRLMLWRRVL